jgi:hypothetical protein
LASDGSTERIATLISNSHSVGYRQSGSADTDTTFDSGVGARIISSYAILTIWQVVKCARVITGLQDIVVIVNAKLWVEEISHV